MTAANPCVCCTLYGAAFLYSRIIPHDMFMRLPANSLMQSAWHITAYVHIHFWITKYEYNPQTAPQQKPLEGRENDVQLRQPHDDTLHTPGMGPLHHRSDTTYQSNNFVRLVHNRYSLTMIWCWDLHIITQSHDLYDEILIGTKKKPDDGHEWPKHVLILILKNIHPWYHTSCVFDYPATYLYLLFPQFLWKPWRCSMEPWLGITGLNSGKVSLKVMLLILTCKCSHIIDITGRTEDIKKTIMASKTTDGAMGLKGNEGKTT